jgi:hypothetical protein
MKKFGFTENSLINNNIALLNSSERDKTSSLSEKEFNERLKNDQNPTDDERRMGIYKEFLEPQVRDAVLTLVKKGYVTIDSGYDGRKYSKGIQYIGFQKGMIDSSLLLLIDKVLDAKIVKATIEFDQRDFLVLTPELFLTLEEWKKIWDDVVEVFPDQGAPAPFREEFINKIGH